MHLTGDVIGILWLYIEEYNVAYCCGGTLRKKYSAYVQSITHGVTLSIVLWTL